MGNWPGWNSIKLVEQESAFLFNTVDILRFEADIHEKSRARDFTNDQYSLLVLSKNIRCHRRVPELDHVCLLVKEHRSLLA